MNVIALNGSPRRSRAHSMLILDPLLHGLDEAGAHVELFHLADLKIGPCLECYDCWFKTPGQCVVHDDVQMLLERLQDADLWVLATGVNLGGMSASLKNLLDRTLPLLEPAMEVNQEQTRHKIRGERQGGQVALVASCAHWELGCFDLVVAQTRSWCVQIGREFAGAVLRPHAFALPHMMWLGKETSHVLDAARKLGNTLAREGKMHEDLLQVVGSELMEARVYARHMNQVMGQALESAELGTRSSGDDRLEVEVVSHPFTFKGSDDKELTARIVEAVNRMGGVGRNAEGAYRRTLDVLHAHAEEAVPVIAQEYEALPEGSYSDRWSLVQLLSELRHPASLKALDTIVRSPIPEERSKILHEYSTRAEELVIRTTAVEAIARIAAQENQEAQELLLQFARHAELSVRRAAAQGYLEAGGEQARERLMEALPQEDHWLLKIRRTGVHEVPQPRIYDRTAPPDQGALPPREDQIPPEERRPRKDGPMLPGSGGQRVSRDKDKPCCE